MALKTYHFLDSLFCFSLQRSKPLPESSQNYHDDFTLKSVEKKFFSLYQNSIKNGSRSSLGPKEARKNHF